MKTIVTNLRIPEEDWMRVRASAANMGMSANAYIKSIIDDTVRREFFAYTEKPTPPRKRARFYEPLWKMIERPSPRKPMKASDEDKIIYGV